MAATCEMLGDTCGVIALGRCHSCARAFCGTHQAQERQIPYTDYCTECQTAKALAERRGIASAQEADARRLADIEDPIERLIVAMSTICVVRSTGCNVGKNMDVLTDACPEVWPTRLGAEADLNHDPAWDDRTIATWFARRATSQAVPPTRTVARTEVRRGMFGGRHAEQHDQPAWWLHCEAEHGVFIEADGALTFYGHGTSRLRGDTLVEMAKVLGVGPFARPTEDEAAAARRAAEAARQGPEWDRIAEWETEAAACLTRVSDLAERTVRAITEVGTARTDELRRLIPQSWDDHEIVTWFIGAVREPPTAPERLVYEDGFWGPNAKRRPAWCFNDGGQAPGHGPGADCVCVLTDGRIWWGNSFTAGPGDKLNAKTLHQMHRLARLQPVVPPRPQPARAPY